eukprot:12926387-Prorocentrum_lima.AAC.1
MSLTSLPASTPICPTSAGILCTNNNTTVHKLFIGVLPRQMKVDPRADPRALASPEPMGQLVKTFMHLLPYTVKLKKH